MAKQTKRRGTPARTRTAPARPGAMVRVAEKRLALATGKRAPRVQLLPPEPAVERTLAENEVQLGELGFAEIKLTETEERILSEPVPADEVLLKPTGQPYLSHPSYTRWFNRAFGRMGWALVPASRPSIQGTSVVCAYVLHIHRQPAALAWGEQEYHANNKEQTYGDALEATVANALRRCAKRLGVGLELWDRRWLHEWMEANAVEVWVKAREEGGKARKMYRRKSDPPFWNEEASRSSRRSAPDNAPPAKTVENPGHHAQTGEPITDKQRGRLYVMVQNSGRTDDEVRKWLQAAYGFASSRAITRDKYDEICRLIEATGDLKGRA